MNKLFRIIIFISVLNSHKEGLAQSKSLDSSLIKWSETNKIKWSDFSYVSIYSQYGAASLTTFIGNFYTRNDSVFFCIESFFSKKKSWRNEVRLNEYNLNHEQVHFDITELFARKITQKIMTSNLDEFGIQDIYNEYIKACDLFQDLYDKETQHSLNNLNQVKWNKRVESELKLLDKYKEQEVLIKNPICKICWGNK